MHDSFWIRSHFRKKHFNTFAKTICCLFDTIKGTLTDGFVDLRWSMFESCEASLLSSGAGRRLSAAEADEEADECDGDMDGSL